VTSRSFGFAAGSADDAAAVFTSARLDVAQDGRLVQSYGT
jgi:hypothetical protein